MVITLSAREVVAVGGPFRRRGETLSDPGVALDEVSTLRASQEPLVLRVEADGGSERARRMVVGDWLCDSDGAAPAKIASPVWDYSGSSLKWANGRPLLDAWEACDDARWMLRVAVVLGVDGRSIVRAGCECARKALRHVRPGNDAPLRAIEEAEAWARGEEADPTRAAHAIYQGGDPYDDGDELSAADAASFAASGPSCAAYAADSAAETADDKETELRRMARVVRRHVPTISALRAAAARPERRDRRQRPVR